jgi:hypothetical protein
VSQLLEALTAAIALTVQADPGWFAGAPVRMDGIAGFRACPPANLRCTRDRVRRVAPVRDRVEGIDRAEWKEGAGLRGAEYGSRRRSGKAVLDHEYSCAEGDSGAREAVRYPVTRVLPRLGNNLFAGHNGNSTPRYPVTRFRSYSYRYRGREV